MMFNLKHFAIKNPKSVAGFVATGWLLLMVVLLLSVAILLLLLVLLLVVLLIVDVAGIPAASH